MTITYGELINEIVLNLSGYTLRQERMTYITSPLTDSGLTLNLRDISNIGKGIIEIDDELIYIDSYDRNSNTATIAPWGRGYNGTTAVAHSDNAKVTVAPTFPRIAIKRAINETLQSLYPRLYGIGNYEFNYNPVVNTYELPSAIQSIQGISFSTVGPSKEWQPIRQWRQDPMASLTTWTSGNTLTVYDNIPAGRTIQIQYTTIPSSFDSTAADSAVFETVTGLQTSARDIIVYGSCYRLASFIDAGRMNYISAEADQADTKIQYGSAASTSRYFFSIFQQRLAEEENKLRDQSPTRIHYTRY
jgi:hypothetical protein